MGRENRTGVFELPSDPQIEDLLRVFGRRIKLSIRTNTVGTIVTFNPTTQLATVRVDVLEVFKLVTGAPGVDPNLVNAEIPQTPPLVLAGVPVQIAGTGTSYLSHPLLPGATGVLHVMDRSIRPWMQAVASMAVDPVQSATHALHDAVFVPGLRAKRDAITPPIDLTATVLHDDTLLKLGRAAVLGVARLTDTTSSDATMTAWIIASQAVLAGAAALLALPVPVPPTDFGIITAASTKVVSE